MLPTINGVSPSRLCLPPGHWSTLLDYLCYKLPAVTREDWAARMHAGEVLDAQGQALPPETPYPARETVYYYRKLAHEPAIPFEETIVFQDDFLVVADKPHFLPVVPSGRYVQETLLVRLKRKLGIDTLVPMHRIDRDTAGLVVFTVQPATRAAYQALFRDRLVSKTYEAIAPWRDDLVLPQTYRSRLVESERFMAMQEVDGEANAETTVELIARTGACAHYRLRPRTGQKHQLRAHMHALGVPIINDLIYPVLLPDGIPDYTRPLQLLARELSFVDPYSGVTRRFESQRQLALAPT